MAKKWGIAVDLDRCTGCGACVTACHAENNIPTVGPEQAGRGRAMHWLRVERYWEGDFPDVRLKFRPVMCQQCDAAPCEPVCPTYASHHTEEGLNAQVYNRCIGTGTARTPARTTSGSSTSSTRSGPSRSICS